MADFDPYQKWLGIESQDLPPDHYQLLGIAAFEADTAVIQKAADERMASVRKFATGRHSKLSQSVLNQVAAAKICLLDDSKKAEYDAQLRNGDPKPPPAPASHRGPATPAVTVVTTVNQSDVVSANSPIPPPPPEPNANVVQPAAPIINPTRAKSYSKRRRTNPSLWLVIGCAIIGVAGLAGYAATRPGTDNPLDEASETLDEDIDDQRSEPGGTDDFRSAPPIPKITLKPRPSDSSTDVFEWPKDDMLAPDATSKRPKRPLDSSPDRARPVPSQSREGMAEVGVGRRIAPPTDDQREAAKRVAKAYDIDAANTPEQKRNLAAIMYRDASGDHGPAERFVLLKRARILAMEGSDLKTAFEAASLMSKYFKVDEFGILADIIVNTNIPTDQPKLNQTLTVVGLRIIQDAVAQDRFELASQMATRLTVTAGRAGESDLRKRVDAAARQIRLRQRPFLEAQSALAKLSQSPNDPESNQIAGRYFCYVKNDWQKGLPMLAKGGGARVAQLSSSELSEPRAAAQGLAIADGWLEVAQSDDAFLSASVALQRENVLRHAMSWYERIARQLPAEKRAMATRRISEIAAVLEGQAESVGSDSATERNIWYMVDVSMKPMAEGTSRGDFPKQRTSDARGPFAERGVYFRQAGGRERDIVYEIQWDRDVKQIYFKGAGLRGFRMEVLELRTRHSLASIGPYGGGNQWREFTLNVPRNAGRRFFLHIHNEVSDWFYIHRIELR